MENPLLRSKNGATWVAGKRAQLVWPRGLVLCRLLVSANQRFNQERLKTVNNLSIEISDIVIEVCKQCD